MDGVNFYIDKKSLVEIKKGLNDLFPKTNAQNKAIAKALKKSAIPLRQVLKSLIKTRAKKTGKLQKSIRIFPSKRNTKYGRPSVFVGPIIKVPKRLKKQDGRTQAEIKSDAAAYVKAKSGFYFYFLEYGFGPKGSKKKKSGLGLLPEAATLGGPASLGRLEKDVFDMLNKKSMKLFGKPLK